MNFNSIGFRYQNITGMPSDIERLQTAANIRSEPWYIMNVLPSILYLFLKKNGSFQLSFLTEIGPQKVIKYSSGYFAEGDKIYTFYKKDGKYIPFLESYTIIPQAKTIKLGAVTYSSEGGRGGSQTGYYDMKGVWLANRLPIPLDVYYKGNLVVQLYGYNGLDYMGGGASEVYFDNNRQGLHYLDTLEFRYSLPSDTKKLFSVTIDDVECMKMFIGTVSSTAEAPFPDNSVYRVNEPNYTGVTYFIPVGDGKSLMTNPLSPFYS